MKKKEGNMYPSLDTLRKLLNGTYKPLLSDLKIELE